MFLRSSDDRLISGVEALIFKLVVAVNHLLRLQNHFLQDAHYGVDGTFFLAVVRRRARVKS
jgi:hypothetical protein